jgi:hypothetical protein
MIVPFTIHDALKLAFARGDDMHSAMLHAKQKERGDGFTYQDDDGMPIFAGGIVPMWGRVGTAWLSVGPNIRELRPITLVRRVKEGIDLIIQKRGYSRIQAYTEADDPMTGHMCKRLGFVLEGRMEKYLVDGGAAFQWALFPKVTNV